MQSPRLEPSRCSVLSLSLQLRSFKNKVEDEMVLALTPSLLTCHPRAIYQKPETLFQTAMFCASSANQCSVDELVPQLDERVGVGVGVGTGELLH